MKRIIPILLLLLIACNKDDDKNEVPVVEGIVMTNNIGEQIGQMGNPNNNNSLDDKTLLVFPNPADKDGRFTLFIENPNNENVHVWIEHAILSTELQEDYADAAYKEVENSDEYLFEVNNLSDANISLVVMSFGNGAYRVNVKIGNDLLWDNILIIN